MMANGNPKKQTNDVARRRFVKGCWWVYLGILNMAEVEGIGSLLILRTIEIVNEGYRSDGIHIFANGLVQPITHRTSPFPPCREP
jgi:hypothetical protein